MSRLTIIIPVFNGLSYTQKCLQTLDDQLAALGVEKENIQIVIVDDNSRDGTAEWVKEHYSHIHILKGNGSLWWSGGINMGVKYALNDLKSQYILWWNNDIISDKNYFRNLLEILDTYSKETIIGSKVFVLHENKIWGMGGKFDPKSGAKYMYGALSQNINDYDEILEVDWFPGMGTTIHRSVFEKIGLLDEELFPQYHGDSDFTYRAKKAGFKLLAFPQLRLYNDIANTGLKHKGSIKGLYNSLTSIKSNYNVKKDLAFAKKHSESIKAYMPLFMKYFTYTGGFFKWSVLSFLGYKKKV